MSVLGGRPEEMNAVEADVKRFLVPDSFQAVKNQEPREGARIIEDQDLLDPDAPAELLEPGTVGRALGPADGHGVVLDEDQVVEPEAAFIGKPAELIQLAPGFEGGGVEPETQLAMPRHGAPESKAQTNDGKRGQALASHARWSRTGYCRLISSTSVLTSAWSGLSRSDALRASMACAFCPVL